MALLQGACLSKSLHKAMEALFKGISFCVKDFSQVGMTLSTVSNSTEPVPEVSSVGVVPGSAAMETMEVHRAKRVKYFFIVFITLKGVNRYIAHDGGTSKNYWTGVFFIRLL